MNKEAFLRELEQSLRARQLEDPQAYLDYFEEIFEDMQEVDKTGNIGDTYRYLSLRG